MAGRQLKDRTKKHPLVQLRERVEESVDGFDEEDYQTGIARLCKEKDVSEDSPEGLLENAYNGDLEFLVEDLCKVIKEVMREVEAGDDKENDDDAAGNKDDGANGHGEGHDAPRDPVDPSQSIDILLSADGEEKGDGADGEHDHDAGEGKEADEGEKKKEKPKGKKGAKKTGPRPAGKGAKGKKEAKAKGPGATEKRAAKEKKKGVEGGGDAKRDRLERGAKRKATSVAMTDEEVKDMNKKRQRKGRMVRLNGYKIPTSALRWMDYRTQPLDHRF